MPCSRGSRLSLPLDMPGFRVLCPTRWTVRATSLQSVLDNFEVLLCVWEEAQCAQLDSEMRARIVGVNAQMQTFDFLFGVSLGNLLRHTDNLSKKLQLKSISAAEGQRLATLTLDILQSLREEDKFKLFYSKVLQDQVRFDVQPPSLPRKRKHLGNLRLVLAVEIFTLVLKIATARSTLRHSIL